TGVRGAGSVIAAVPKLPRETATPLVARLTRPSTGKFDAVVIQSNVLDQFPESKTLLTGRPVYTVYLPMGTAKDWILHFCIPGGEGGAGKQNGPVVRLSAGAPVQAPYPTIMLRPVIVLLPGERYVLLHGFITSEGRFEKLRIVKPGTAQTNELLLSSLPSWEFRPATRDGQPMRVEFLLAIPPDQL
ncbi:MAG: hypothetical protein HYZ57_21160, partial [Acidobacteria bacterium]|nr:hypothetical protein [Acidobacteriota bacterium]MBI3282336.1 hypothetical protein [Acidobacteriota bacterium]